MALESIHKCRYWQTKILFRIIAHMKDLLTFLTVDAIAWISDNIAVPIAGGIGAGINWLLNKRKNNAEAKTVELSNEEKVLDKWIKWSEKMESELTEVKNELHQQKVDCDADTQHLQGQIVELEHRVLELERENNELKKRA